MKRENKTGTIIFLGIGTSEGDRVENLKMTLTLINESIGEVLAVSGVYETEPWGFESSSKFLNMVARVRTGLAPAALLKKAQEIENKLGRRRDPIRYSSRTIDVDILLYGKQVVRQKKLTVPHPLIPERRFVLVPLCDLAPGEIHPVLKKTFSDLLTECPDTGKAVDAEIRLTQHRREKPE